MKKMLGIQFYSMEKMIIVQFHSIEKVPHASSYTWSDQKCGNFSFQIPSVKNILL